MTNQKKRISTFFIKIFSILKIAILLTLIPSLLTSCKEIIIINTETIDSEALIATVKIPEYKSYPEFSDYIKKEIENDLQDYKKYAEMDFPYSSITSTYRTEAEDFSNSKYLNCFIKKYIYAGENIEDEYFITFVFNKKTKEIETLENLTGKTLSELSKYCKDALMKKQEWESDYEYNVISEDIKNGTRPVQENYNAFIAGNKNITIHFSSGQVLSKWYGPQTVTISYK